MPRGLRIERAGALYHVMNRGNHYKKIVRDGKDVAMFLKTVGEVCEFAGWSIHAYAVMGNHYHLLVETHQATLIKGMQWLNGTYTQRYNARYKLRGHLFQGRYKSIIVDNIPHYLQMAIDYIHMNPVKAGIVGKFKEFLAWPGGSAGLLTGDRKECPEWLRWERVYGLYGMDEWKARNRDQYRENLERRFLEVKVSPKQEKEADRKYLRRWYLGGEEFVEKLTEEVESWMGKVKNEEWTGEPVMEAEAIKVERLIRKCCQVMEKKRLDQMTAEEMYVVVGWIYDRSVMDSRWWAEKLGEKSPGSLRKKLSNMKRKLPENKKWNRLWKKLSQISA